MRTWIAVLAVALFGFDADPVESAHGATAILCFEDDALTKVLP